MPGTLLLTYQSRRQSKCRWRSSCDRRLSGSAGPWSHGRNDTCDRLNTSHGHSSWGSHRFRRELRCSRRSNCSGWALARRCRCVDIWETCCLTQKNGRQLRWATALSEPSPQGSPAENNNILLCPKSNLTQTVVSLLGFLFYNQTQQT